MSDTAARRQIESDGLKFHIAGTAYSETVKLGAVMASKPGPGDPVLRNGTVDVTISRGPERHNVPTLTGMSLQQARDQLTANKLKSGSERLRYDDAIVAGKVISSDPVAGTALKRDASVVLVVSRGPKPITVESFEGHNAADAKATLTKLGFTVTMTHQWSESVDKGNVIGQDPNSGTGHRGDTIALVVSSGPPLVEVPNVVRSGVEAAKQTLREAGFAPRVRRNAIDFGLGFVIRQDPGANDKAPKGSVVTITVV
jgi:serine/threonine-protein kinase